MEAEDHRTFESKSPLWAREQSQQTKVEGILEGGILVPQPQSSGWKRENRVSIIIFVFYFWNLAVPGSRGGTTQWGDVSDKAS